MASGRWWRWRSGRLVAWASNWDGSVGHCVRHGVHGAGNGGPEGSASSPCPVEQWRTSPSGASATGLLRAGGGVCGFAGSLVHVCVQG